MAGGRRDGPHEGGDSSGRVGLGAVLTTPGGVDEAPVEGRVVAVISVEGLGKVYGQTRAVDGVSFDVGAGEIFGIIGPNGAGKTTTVECLEGLRVPDEGRVRVLGLDPQRQGDALRERMGAQLQQSALPARLRVGEAMTLFASFYAHPLPCASLLGELGLADRVRVAWGDLSGGQRQRLAIALALVGDPEVVFFDELTSGLDPQARRATWDLVSGVRERGKTIVLTTHFMEEAERLCDRVLIIDHGQVVAMDTPGNLVESLAAERRVSFECAGAGDEVLDALRTLPTVARVERSGDRVIVHSQSDRSLTAILGILDRAGVSYRDLRTEQSSLEDVFLALTGREMRD
jgi:ABC-2 type transport system ATP-binding protein